jgi:hypothetical protein
MGKVETEVSGAEPDDHLRDAAEVCRLSVGVAGEVYAH